MILNQDQVLAGRLAPEGIAGQLFAGVGSHVGSGVNDIGELGVGIGSQMQCSISVLKTLGSDGQATVQFRIEQADDLALSVGAQLVVASEVMELDRLKQGALVVLPIHYAALAPKRYMGLRIVIAGAPLTNTQGWCFAGLMPRELPKVLAPSGFAIR